MKMEHRFKITMVAALLTITPVAAKADQATSTDSNPTVMPEVVIPEKYSPRTAAFAPLAPSTSPTPAPKGTNVWFTPQDENTSTTILLIYNTSKKDALVGLKTFSTGGSVTINTSFTVPAGEMVHICSDSVSTVSAAWTDAMLVNMTTFSAFGVLTLPSGVKAEGYVAYDTTGTYDPLTATQIIPLRFSVKDKTSP
jgi:hypothetical protein